MIAAAETTNLPERGDQTPEFIEREEGRHVVYQFRNKTFRLDKAKARERLNGKRVINGTRSAELNVLPLKYSEAYRIYKQMKANHWEPDVIDMTKDAHQWNTGALSSRERWIIEMFAGLSARDARSLADRLQALKDHILTHIPADEGV